MNRKKVLCIHAITLFLPVMAAADTSVPIYAVTDAGKGALLGKITIGKAAHGLVFTPTLAGLPPGLHGFHLHENPSCDPAAADGKTTAAMAAGSHYDPSQSKKHGSPTSDGHLGDLPVLSVDAAGNATTAVTAPRLMLDDISRHALVIHANDDNYSDTPPVGGSGARIACGVVDNNE